jgi:hypothetical protein
MATITPPPGHNRAVASTQSNIVVGAIKAGGKGKKSVTPAPEGPKDKEKASKPKQPSKEALAIHRKWQVEAEKMGGPENKIVVSKPAAKKLIFDMLHDAFRPMNITEVYQVSCWHRAFDWCISYFHRSCFLLSYLWQSTETKGCRPKSHSQGMPR